MQVDESSPERRETEPRAVGDMPVASLVEELGRTAEHQNALVAQLRASYSGESAAKDEEIA